MTSPERRTAGTLVFYVGLGVEHILGGIDHLLFLLALLRAGHGLWQTVKIVTAFTVAHSITLSLAALGMVEVPSSIVEPLIAASIVWVAVENLVAPAGAARRWLIAGVFGLIHGLGFASALVELGLSRDVLLQALVGFNIGVELGQLAFVAVVLPPLVWASRPGRLPRLPQVLSAIVALVGAVWLVERVLAVNGTLAQAGAFLLPGAAICRFIRYSASGDEIDRLLPAGGGVDRFRRGSRHQHRPGDARS